MKRATFDPNVHGRFAWWSSTWLAEAETALTELERALASRYPGARLVRGDALSAIYALRDDAIVGVAWIEPEMFEGRVVGVERFIGALAGRA